MGRKKIVLSEPPLDEPPHPEFWENKWPHPKSVLKEPDQLLSYIMDWYGFNPTDFKKRKSRYQFIYGYGRFRCRDENCFSKEGERKKWTSHWTWVRFDLFSQTVRVFGQKCNKCKGYSYGGRYVYPSPFFYEEWRSYCLKAVDLAFKKYYQKEDILEENTDEGVFSSLTEEEQHSMLESFGRTAPHEKDLCQRCKERGGACWYLHKPEDCERCLASPMGICYDPKLLRKIMDTR